MLLAVVCCAMGKRPSASAPGAASGLVVTSGAAAPGSASASAMGVHSRPSRQIACVAPDRLQVLPGASELAAMGRNGLRKRARELGVETRYTKDDRSGWAWRRKEDVFRDCERKLAVESGTVGCP